MSTEYAPVKVPARAPAPGGRREQGRRRPGSGGAPPRRPSRPPPWVGYLFIAPSAILLVLVVIVPLIQAIGASFTNWDGMSPPTPVGLANYRFLLEWQEMRRIALNTTLLLGGIVLWVALPFVLATMIFQRRGADTIRTVLFLPAVFPPVIVGGVFRMLLTEQGPLNSVLRRLGLDVMAMPWLSHQWLVLVTIVFVIAWAVMGSGVLFYSAGLSALPRDYVEAAVVDGASFRQLLWNIYRPALRPITRFWVLLLTITTVTGFFPWIHGLTRGGPGVASTTLDYQVYRAGIQSARLGLGSSIAVVSLLFIVVFLTIQNVISHLRKDEPWTS